MKKLFILLLFPCWVYAQEQTHVDVAPVYDTVAQTNINHWLVSLKTDLFVVTQNEKIITLGIKDRDSDKRLDIYFQLDSLKPELSYNKFFSDSKRFNSLLKIYVDPKFSRMNGGKIILDIYKKTGWETDSLFIHRNEDGFVITQNKIFCEQDVLNSILIQMSFRANYVKKYLPTKED